MSARPLNSIVVNLVVIETGPRQKRVIAVEWERHEGPHGADLDINTDGWIACPASGCRWSYDPDSRCPVHEGGVA